ncbi:hypothetical protein B0H16DRAFT_1856570 [Mycena metata]|uniref:Uncharacterized protein n=1 Tax=Mycena metata TaxID=1033252 RepID=A0AAD7IKQ2_9AGAR|nr:hypothetical protein B0H16DRAFT_1856570 [Mycena metata]
MAASSSHSSPPTRAPSARAPRAPSASAPRASFVLPPAQRHGQPSTRMPTPAQEAAAAAAVIPGKQKFIAMPNEWRYVKRGYRAAFGTPSPVKGVPATPSSPSEPPATRRRTNTAPPRANAVASAAKSAGKTSASSTTSKALSNASGTPKAAARTAASISNAKGAVQRFPDSQGGGAHPSSCAHGGIPQQQAARPNPTPAAVETPSTSVWGWYLPSSVSWPSFMSISPPPFISRHPKKRKALTPLPGSGRATQTPASSPTKRQDQDGDDMEVDEVSSSRTPCTPKASRSAKAGATSSAHRHNGRPRTPSTTPRTAIKSSGPSARSGGQHTAQRAQNHHKRRKLGNDARSSPATKGPAETSVSSSPPAPAVPRPPPSSARSPPPLRPPPPPPSPGDASVDVGLMNSAAEVEEGPATRDQEEDGEFFDSAMRSIAETAPENSAPTTSATTPATTTASATATTITPAATTATATPPRHIEMWEEEEEEERASSPPLPIDAAIYGDSVLMLPEDAEKLESAARGGDAAGCKGYPQNKGFGSVHGNGYKTCMLACTTVGGKQGFSAHSYLRNLRTTNPRPPSRTPGSPPAHRHQTPTPSSLYVPQSPRARSSAPQYLPIDAPNVMRRQRERLLVDIFFKQGAHIFFEPARMLSSSSASSAVQQGGRDESAAWQRRSHHSVRGRWVESSLWLHLQVPSRLPLRREVLDYDVHTQREHGRSPRCHASSRTRKGPTELPCSVDIGQQDPPHPAPRAPPPPPRSPPLSRPPPSYPAPPLSPPHSSPSQPPLGTPKEPSAKALGKKKAKSPAAEPAGDTDPDADSEDDDEVIVRAAQNAASESFARRLQAEELLKLERANAAASESLARQLQEHETRQLERQRGDGDDGREASVLWEGLDSHARDALASMDPAGAVVALELGPDDLEDAVAAQRQHDQQQQGREGGVANGDVEEDMYIELGDDEFQIAAQIGIVPGAEEHKTALAAQIDADVRRQRHLRRARQSAAAQPIETAGAGSSRAHHNDHEEGWGGVEAALDSEGSDKSGGGEDDAEEMDVEQGLSAGEEGSDGELRSSGVQAGFGGGDPDDDDDDEDDGDARDDDDDEALRRQKDVVEQALAVYERAYARLRAMRRERRRERARAEAQEKRAESPAAVVLSSTGNQPRPGMEEEQEEPQRKQEEEEGKKKKKKKKKQRQGQKTKERGAQDSNSNADSDVSPLSPRASPPSAPVAPESHANGRRRSARIASNTIVIHQPEPSPTARDVWDEPSAFYEWETAPRSAGVGNEDAADDERTASTSGSHSRRSMRATTPAGADQQPESDRESYQRRRTKPARASKTAARDAGEWAGGEDSSDGDGSDEDDSQEDSDHDITPPPTRPRRASAPSAPVASTSKKKRAGPAAKGLCCGCGKGPGKRPIYRGSALKWDRSCENQFQSIWGVKVAEGIGMHARSMALRSTNVDRFVQWVAGGENGVFTLIDDPSPTHLVWAEAVESRARQRQLPSCEVTTNGVVCGIPAYRLIPTREADPDRWCSKHRANCDKAWEQVKGQGPDGETRPQMLQRQRQSVADVSLFPVYYLFLADPTAYLTKIQSRNEPGVLAARPPCHLCGKQGRDEWTCPSPCGETHTLCADHHQRLQIWTIDSAPAARILRDRRPGTPLTDCPKQTVILRLLTFTLPPHWVDCMFCSRRCTFALSAARDIGLHLDHRHGDPPEVLDGDPPEVLDGDWPEVRGWFCSPCNAMSLTLADGFLRRYGEGAEKKLLDLLIPSDIQLVENDPRFSQWRRYMDAFIESRPDLKSIPVWLWSELAHMEYLQFCFFRMGYKNVDGRGRRRRPGFTLHHCHVTGRLIAWLEGDEAYDNMALGPLEQEARSRATDAAGQDPSRDEFYRHYQLAVRAVVEDILRRAVGGPPPLLRRLFDAVDENDGCLDMLERFVTSIPTTTTSVARTELGALWAVMQGSEEIRAAINAIVADWEAWTVEELHTFLRNLQAR